MSVVTTARRDWWRWFRQPWVVLAAGVLVMEFVVLWAVSAKGHWGTGQSPRARHSLAPLADVDTRLSQWLWVMHPGIMLAPTTKDFSGAAWMVRKGVEVEFESLKPTVQPLPYEPLPRVATEVGLGLRSGRSHDWQWELPTVPLTFPAVSALPFPASTTARLEQGGASLVLRLADELPLAPAGAAPERLVLRLTVDRQGAVAAPPLVWESSGDAALDAALVSRALRWTFEVPAESQALGGDFSVLVRVDWGIQTVAAPTPTASGTP